MFCSFLDRYRDAGLLVLRVGVGAMMAIAHGWPKLIAGPEMWNNLGQSIGHLGVPVFAPTFWGFMAAFAEFFGGIALVLGLFHRPAAFLLLCTMVVATAMHVGNGDPFGSKTSRPIEMGIVFIALIILGPGRYALCSLFVKPKPIPQAD